MALLDVESAHECGNSEDTRLNFGRYRADPSDKGIVLQAYLLENP